VTDQHRTAAVREAELARFAEALAEMPVRQGALERLLRRAFRVGCRLVGWRLEVEGMEALPRAAGGTPGSGCVVVAAPHRAWVEPFLLLLAWPADAARLTWLADGHTATRSWWRRRLLPYLGVIPIRGDVSGPRAYAELVAPLLEAGGALVVFPEVGPPSSPGRTRRFSPGFGYLARRAGAPVVPVVIGGTHHIVRGSHFSVVALDTLEVGPAESDPFTIESRERARSLAARCREAIEGALPTQDALADARAPAQDRWSWLAHLFD
jgi:1-acyl-sn-glycerol-3-phosphate acyltransferase